MKLLRVKVFLLVMVLLVTACTDKDLETTAKALLSASQALITLQQTVISANAATPKLISDDATSKILVVLIQVNEAGKEADKITRAINKLAPSDRMTLLQILDPVILSIGNAVNSLESLGITDPRTKNAIQASLLLIQTSLNTAKLALAAR